MKKFGLFVILTTNFLLFSTNSVFADWHDFKKDPPKENQLHMVVHMYPAEYPGDRQVYVITHYDGEFHGHAIEEQGWWDVTRCELWKWVHEGSRMLYVPDLSNGKLLPDFLIDWYGN